MSRILWYTRGHGWLQQLGQPWVLIHGPATQQHRLLIVKHTQHIQAYLLLCKKSIDSASVCLHKGDSCACLSSIVEMFLGFLKEAIDCIIKHTEPKAADLFPIKASITFLVRLCWRKTMIRQSRVMRLLGMVIDRSLMILMPLSNMLIDSILFFNQLPYGFLTKFYIRKRVNASYW